MREYTTRISTLLLDVPAGRYQTSWFNPRTGDVDQPPTLQHPGGPIRIQTPEYDEDIALKLVRFSDPTPASRPATSKPRR